MAPVLHRATIKNPSYGCGGYGGWQQRVCLTERLLARLEIPRDAPLLPGNDQFRRGDRVVVQADPHDFREMQTERYGGWNDEMALVRHRHYHHHQRQRHYHDNQLLCLLGLGTATMNLR